jgi:hypothetical protein
MEMLEALGFRGTKPLEDAEDEKRHKSRRRRRRVVECAALEPERKRLAPHGAVALKVGAHNRAADPLEVRGKLAPDVASIEVIEPRARELIEGLGELARREPLAEFRLSRWIMGQRILVRASGSISTATLVDVPAGTKVSPMASPKFCASPE